MTALDDIVSDAIKSVYNDVNEKTERFRKSFDLFGRFKKKHAERAARSLSTIQILGMTGPQRLTDIYVPSRLSPRIARNVFISDESVSDLAALRAAAEQTEVNIFDVIHDNKNIVILGGAGSGKTTFASALTLGHLDECEYISNGLRERYFPICFALRELGAPKKPLVDIIQEYINGLDENDAWPFVEKMMLKGRVFVILDGLAQGVTLSKTMRKRAIKHVIESVVYVVDQMEATGINLYMRLVNGEPRLGYTYYKRRSTVTDVHSALNRCIIELCHCNHTPLFTEIKLTIGSSSKINVKLVLGSCFYYKDFSLMKDLFQSISPETDKRVYLGNIAKTLELLNGGDA